MVNLVRQFFLTKRLKTFFLNRTFLEQQRLSITGDTDVEFYFVVFVTCVLLAASFTSAGAVSDCMAAVAAISIGRNYS